MAFELISHIADLTEKCLVMLVERFSKWPETTIIKPAEINVNYVPGCVINTVVWECVYMSEQFTMMEYS